MGWLIALGIVLLLAILPLGISIRYDCDGPSVKLLASVFQFTLYPRPKKQEKSLKDLSARKNAAKKNSAAASKQDTSKKQGGSWADFLPLVSLFLDFLGNLRRKIRVKRLELKLVMAADDPCDLAVNYGRTWAAVGGIMPRLEELFVIKKRDVQVECDFTASKTLVVARLDMTITLGRMIALAATYGVKALRELLKIKNKRKGGADQ